MDMVLGKIRILTNLVAGVVKALSFAILTIYSYQLTAQTESLSNLHVYSITSDTTIVETNTILPNSVNITDRKGQVRRQYYIIDNNTIRITPDEGDTLLLEYRCLSFNIVESRSIIDSSSMDKDYRIGIMDYTYGEDGYNNRRIIQSNKLEYTGSFSRGVSFGNTQDVVLNSNFNLQMRGDLGNGLYVKAAISDENIPIQPEGNTQVLQEFDKIYIEVQKDRFAVIAGDYELARPKSYFMNYYKKLKGISVRSENTINENWTTNNRASFAISRGQFNRQTLEIQEGNQGPYRLLGANNEVFLQVLSGTERVYADGKLLKRGEKNDYVIDYNRAEIRFTPNLIIRANIRILVEFEYSVQRYLRSLYATESTIENDRWKFHINLCNEQDSKSLISNGELDTTDLRILREGGDASTFRNSIFIPDPETGADLIKYRINPEGILSYEESDIPGLVSARFTNVGQGNGDYIINTNIAANGRVYLYVGENMGNYNPVVNIIPPQQKQLATLATEYLISDSTNIYLESSISNVDLNRFSTVNNEDNTGVALHSRFHDVRKLGSKSLLNLETDINVEYASENFEALNPYRPPEFARDWNLDNIVDKNNQALYNASFGLITNQSYLRYTLSGFHDKKIYDGTRHIVEGNYNKSGWKINAIGDYLRSRSNIESTNFLRPRLTASKSLIDNKLIVGAYYEKERNIRNDFATDSLIASSFNYDYYRAYIEARPYDKLSLTWGVSRRTDDRTLDKQLQRVTTSTNIEFSGNWTQSKASTLVWQLVLRDYKVDDIYLTQDSPNKSFIGNIDHKLKLWNNGLTINSYYEANSGQEPKIEFQFIKVQDGEGSYQWNDYNEDGEEQITEFEIAAFANDGAYEKVSIFNNEFISTNRNVLNQSFNLSPSKFLTNKKSLLGKFIFSSRYRIDQKSLNQADGKFIQPINFNLSDEELVSFTASFDHNIFYNRGNPSHDIQLSYRSLNNKVSQISGSELRLTDQYYSRTRVNIKKKVDALVETAFGTRENVHSVFDNRNYNIEFWNVIPQINFRPKSNLRLILKYKIEQSRNTIGTNMERTNIHDGGVSFTWRQNSNSNLQLEFNYVRINYEGEQNTPVEFEMLQGLKDGDNLVWNFNYTRRLSSNIDLILNYNGRKSDASKVIQNAGVQMRALF